MRFRYIDGKGNEVALDSVEALAARIELGAVSSSTELYDAGTDTWGPADGHAVYRQLLAEAAARDFGISPRSSAPLPTARPAPALDIEDPDDSEPETPAPDVPPSDSLADSDVLGLELSIDPSDLNPLAQTPLDSGIESNSLNDMDSEGTFDLGQGLTLSSSSAGGFRADEPWDDAAAEPVDQGDPDVPYEYRREPDASQHDTGEGSDGFAAGGPDSFGRADDPWDGGRWQEDETVAGEPEPVAAGAHREEMDNPWGTPPPASPHPFDSPAIGDDAGGAWPDPALATDEEPTTGRKILEVLAAPGVQWGFLAGSFLVMAFFGSAIAQGLLFRGSVTVAGVVGIGVLAGLFLWRDPENRTLIPAATFGLVAVLSVPLFVLGSKAQAANPVGSRETRSAARSATNPGSVSAANPGERAMDGRAMEEVIDGMDRLAVSYGLDRRPVEWLQGVYLANASQFPEVKQYWTRYQDYLDEVRSQDAEWFRASYQERLSAAGVSPAAIPGIVERGVARFQASADRREDLYDGMQELVESSLELHALLLKHEASIDHHPWDRGGISADPVVEAVVRDPAVEDRMWALIARVAVALESVSSLGQTSAEHLQSALLDSLRATLR